MKVVILLSNIVLVLGVCEENDENCYKIPENQYGEFIYCLFQLDEYFHLTALLLMGGISDFEDHGRTVMTEKMAQLLFANGKFININFYAPLKLNYDIHRRYMFPQSSISNAN